MSEGAFNQLLLFENLEATNPRRIAMIKSFEETKNNDTYGKGSINIVLPFLFFPNPEKFVIEPYLIIFFWKWLNLFKFVSQGPSRGIVPGDSSMKVYFYPALNSQ